MGKQFQLHYITSTKHSEVEPLLQTSQPNTEQKPPIFSQHVLTNVSNCLRW